MRGRGEERDDCKVDEHGMRDRVIIIQSLVRTATETVNIPGWSADPDHRGYFIIRRME
jgi:hypothetical protein